MHCYKMEATVIENSESKIKSESEVKSKCQPPPGGIKKVRRFKRGHPYWGTTKCCNIRNSTNEPQHVAATTEHG